MPYCFVMRARWGLKGKDTRETYVKKYVKQTVQLDIAHIVLKICMQKKGVKSLT